MKIATTKAKTLKFNGNCKGSRIRKALKLTEKAKDRKYLVHNVIASRGIYDKDSANVRRYAAGILLSKDDDDFVKVS